MRIWRCEKPIFRVIATCPLGAISATAVRWRRRDVNSRNSSCPLPQAEAYAAGVTVKNEPGMRPARYQFSL